MVAIKKFWSPKKKNKIKKNKNNKKLKKIISFLLLSTMNYLAEALTDPDEDHDKSGVQQ